MQHLHICRHLLTYLLWWIYMTLTLMLGIYFIILKCQNMLQLIWEGDMLCSWMTYIYRSEPLWDWGVFCLWLRLWFRQNKLQLQIERHPGMISYVLVFATIWGNLSCKTALSVFPVDGLKRTGDTITDLEANVLCCPDATNTQFCNCYFSIH